MLIVKGKWLIKKPDSATDGPKAGFKMKDDKTEEVDELRDLTLRFEVRPIEIRGQILKMNDSHINGIQVLLPDYIFPIFVTENRKLLENSFKQVFSTPWARWWYSKFPKTIEL